MQSSCTCIHRSSSLLHWWLTPFCTCADNADLQDQLSVGSCANGRATATSHSAQIGRFYQESQLGLEASACSPSAPCHTLSLPKLLLQVLWHQVAEGQRVLLGLQAGSYKEAQQADQPDQHSHSLFGSKAAWSSSSHSARPSKLEGSFQGQHAADARGALELELHTLSQPQLVEGCSALAHHLAPLPHYGHAWKGKVWACHAQASPCQGCGAQLAAR